MTFHRVAAERPAGSKSDTDLDAEDEGHDTDEEDDEHTGILIDSIQSQIEHMHPATRRWLMEFLGEIYVLINEEEDPPDDEPDDSHGIEKLVNTSLRDRLSTIEPGYEAFAFDNATYVSRIDTWASTQEPVAPGLEITSAADFSPSTLQEHLSIDVVSAFLILDTYVWAASRKAVFPEVIRRTHSHILNLVEIAREHRTETVDEE